MKQTPWMARQGDVLMIAVPAIPVEAKSHQRPREQGRVILAHGEVTGHAHAIGESAVLAFGPSDDAFWLEVPDGAEVTHEEHATVTIPPDVRYVEVRRQREYSGAGERRVAD